jgi:hypothetical protein
MMLGPAGVPGKGSWMVSAVAAGRCRLLACGSQGCSGVSLGAAAVTTAAGLGKGVTTAPLLGDA